jgi:2-keto-4-pentenoate hydratase/2-oxohepta-3-ene-1,7-dioic acid hydratase in catechol pathway
MRLISYQAEGGARVAARRGADYVDLSAADASLPNDLRDLLDLGDEGLARARNALQRGVALSGPPARILPPIAHPEKVICIGLNYADHAAETGATLPSEPVVFSKFVTAIRGPQDPIVLPKVSSKVDFEAELVVVIGRPGRCIPRERAFEHVAGYTCGHDVSARDWQLEKPGGQWLLGKSFDSFAPIGPELVTREEIENPGQLNICLRLNGQTMQNSNTRQLIFPVDQLVAHISTVCTLQPGDLIFTGTPPGVGVARKPPVFLQPGDVAEVEIESIGVLRNPVVAQT